MALTGEQRRVARTALDEARRLGASPKVLKALIAAGLVESNLRNVNHGDRDSLGFLQQRPSQGWGSPQQVRNVRYATRQFVRRAKPIADKYGNAGDLAQAVQRSAFPERYQQRGGDAERIISALDGGSPGGTSSSRTERITRTVPGVDRSADRKLLLQNYLQQRGRPDALLSLGQGLQGAQDTPERTETTTRRAKRSQRSAQRGDGQTDIEQIIRMAERRGLKVGEHPKRGGVAPVHAPGSYHGRPSRSGSPGSAVDITGPPDALARFQRLVDRRYGRDLEESIYNGPGGGRRNRKNGRRVARGFFSGHTGHYHAADDD